MYADRIQAHNIMIRLQVSAVFHADCMAFANKSRASTDRHDSVSIYWHSVREFFQHISEEDIWPSECFLMLTFQTHHPSNLHSLNLQSSVSFCLVCRCSCQASVLRLAGTVSQRCQGHVRSRIGSLTGSEGVGLKIRANDVNEVTKASQQYQCDPFQA